MEKDYHYQNIEDYVNGKLKGNSKKVFEAQLAADQELAREVAFYQDLSDVSEVVGDESLETLISGIDSELAAEDFFQEKDAMIKTIESKTKTSDNKKGKRPVIKLRKLMSLAASILVLVTAGTLWWSNSNYSNESLASNYFNQQTILSISRTSGENTDIFGEGLKAIKSENYSEAIRFFSNISKQEEAYGEARLYLAIAQFKTQDYQYAISNAEIVAQSSSRFREKARWLQINAMLGSGQTSREFENLLTDMATNSPDNYYRNEASRLKKDLDRFWRKIVF